jgi:hypothetical protein
VVFVFARRTLALNTAVGMGNRKCDWRDIRNQNKRLTETIAAINVYGFLTR